LSDITYLQTTYYAYLWTSFDLYGALAMRDALFAAPSLPNLRVSVHYDPDTGTVLFRLAYRAERSHRGELAAWADDYHLRFAQPEGWSFARHRAFAGEAFGFRCRESGDGSERTLADMARQLERVCNGPHLGLQSERSLAGELAESAVPRTVQLSTSMQNAVAAYIDRTEKPRITFSAVPDYIEVTESMVVEVHARAV
jgi:hypothetical protein